MGRLPACVGLPQVAGCQCPLGDNGAMSPTGAFATYAGSVDFCGLQEPLEQVDCGPFAGQFGPMAKLPVNPLAWLEPDRRRLFLALLLLTHHRLTASRLAVARHALLVDMEIHADPRQGAWSWLFPNEEPLLDRLGEQLQNIGAAALGDDGWSEIIETASALRAHLEANGAGRPLRNVR